jgi:hypothetical protein
LQDNIVKLGVSPSLEGPFNVVELIDMFPLSSMPEDWSAFCVYPHPWAYEEEDGQIMITWWEGGSEGGVIAVRVQLGMTMEMGEPSRAMQKKSSYLGMCTVS